MTPLKNLKDLLTYQVAVLLAAEQQQAAAMPEFIEKVRHASLKRALEHHAGLITGQVDRLKQVLAALGATDQTAEARGIAGLIDEGRLLLHTELSEAVTDAAIIAAVQKVEHYEIAGYGTALAYAHALQMHKPMALLKESLYEEYDADDLLTSLATAAMNNDAITQDIVQQHEPPDNFTQGSDRTEKISFSEKTINSPGGRAGTSHRRYGSGESRGH